MFRRLFTLIAVALLVFADQTPQTLPFTQNWSSTGLITANDNWSGVVGIEGYLGQDITTSTGIDPQTLLAVSTVASDLDVIANQTNPNTLANGGVAEFDAIANPSIALNGSGTADAPYLLVTLNTSGQSNINVAYNLRDLDGSTDNAVQPVALQYRVGNSGNFTNVAAGFVADATTGPSLATLVTPVSATLPAAANNQPLVQVRIITANAAGNDEWVGVDDINITGTPIPRTLSISDVTLSEGNAGTTNYNFTVNLSQPAAAGGVTFDIATADNTATTANNDYVLKALTGQTILSGQSTYNFTVVVNGDTTPEVNETFFVNVTNVVGADAGDTQGLGTITNDDILAISQIQGNGATTPMPGAVVTTAGIVTGVRSNGFYIQSTDASADADPNTSEGIFVFTSTTPPAGAVVGNFVQVIGTVAEFGTTNQVTELTGPTVSVLSTGNPLPAAVTLTAANLTAAGGLLQLERFEGMRVQIGSLTVVQGTDGNVSEANATSTSTGEFYAVITGTATPFREPGIASGLTVPLCAAGSGCAIPVWDKNPELVLVDSDRLGGSAIEVASGNLVTGLVGVVEHAATGYAIYRDGSVTPGVSGAAVPVAAPAASAGEVTIAAANLERFFDTIDDSGVSDVALTSTAFNNRLNKLSLYVRDYLRTPDVVAVSEVENLATLQAAATRINNDAVAALAPNPLYEAHLVEGFDPGGIDVGFLVKKATTTWTEVVQEGAAETFIDPTDGSVDLLNDRPPLRFTGETTRNGQTVAFTVYANHLRSLNGVDTDARVRAKRKAQAESLANKVQARQALNPNELIAVVGDMNAFQFNDGYVDVIGTIAGAPTAPAQVQVASSDLVNPNLRNALEVMPADQRYSYKFEGSAQILDHGLMTEPMFKKLTRAQYVRVNADFPESLRNNSTVPTRLSDHDGLLLAVTSAAEVTSSAAFTSSNILFNRSTNLYQIVVVIRNTSANPITGPMQLVIAGLPNGVTLTNSSGQNAQGNFYTVAGGLAPNATANVTLLISNPARVPIFYTPRLFSGTF